MANVDIKLGYKDSAWFTTNTAIILKVGQIVYLEQTGTYKLGDGVTALSALSFLGGGGSGVQSGLIQIIDKDGDFFTDLATATTYIEQYFNPTIITDKSFNNGVFYFTVPNSTSTENVAVGFLSAADGISTNSASFVDEFGLVNFFLSASNFERNSGYHIMGSVDFQIGDFNQFSGIVQIQNVTGISAALNYFGSNSTGKFIIEGNLGSTETANFGATFFSGSTATIFANASKYTSNAGGIEGDLQRAITNGCNVFFDGIDKAPKASPTFTGTVTTPAVIVSSETASRIVSFDASKNIKSLDTATYPSLTELSYGKGVTSAIQTQLNSKNNSQPIYSGKWRTIPYSAIPSAAGGYHNTVWYVPYIIGNTHTVTDLGIEVITPIGASNIRLALYTDNNGVPGTLIEESGAISSASGGLKTYTFASPRVLDASLQVVWMALQSSATGITLRQSAAVVSNFYINATGVFGPMYNQSQAFGTFPASATPVGFGSQITLLTSLKAQ